MRASEGVATSKEQIKNIKLHIVTDIKVPCLNIICLDACCDDSILKQVKSIVDRDFVPVPTSD